MTTANEKTISTNVTLRSVIHPDDDHFLKDLYISTRDDLAGLFADEAQQLTLLTIQYNAQVASYAEQFPDASHDIVMLDGKAVGRIIVERRSSVICFVDIALLPDARNQGIGTELIKLLIEESAESSVPIELSVLKTNRAQRLYERLGFRVVGDKGTHYLMQFEQQ